MRRARPQLGAPLLALLNLVACTDDFKDVTLIEETRILGGVVSVRGDEDRSTPRPGEIADLSFQLVAPRPDHQEENEDGSDGEDEDEGPDFFSMFVSCTFPERFTGIPICQEFVELLDGVDAAQASQSNIPRIPCIGEMEIEEMGVGFSCKRGAPVVKVSVPTDFNYSSRLVRGVICEGGTPYFDVTEPGLFGCRGGRDPILTHQEIPVSFGDSEDNLNPDPEGFEFEINGELWPALSADVEAALAESPDTPCYSKVARPNSADDLRDLEIPRIDPFLHAIAILVDEDVLEDTAEGREVLEMAAHSTNGEILRWLTIFDEDADVDDGQVVDTLEWTGTGIDPLADEGSLVDFYFTARDRRGGFTVLRRTACVYSEFMDTRNEDEDEDEDD